MISRSNFSVVVFLINIFFTMNAMDNTKNTVIAHAITSINSRQAITEDTFIDGDQDNQDLMFDKNGEIYIASNTNLYVKNIRILNIRPNSFVFEDETAGITFENAELHFLKDYTFSRGAISILRGCLTFCKSIFAKQKTILVVISPNCHIRPQSLKQITSSNDVVCYFEPENPTPSFAHSSSNSGHSQHDSKPEFAKSGSQSDNTDSDDDKK